MGPREPPCHGRGDRRPQLHPGLVPQTVQGFVYIYGRAGCGTVPPQRSPSRAGPRSPGQEWLAVFPERAEGPGGPNIWGRAGGSQTA